jgi:hypothetical protein
VAPPVIACLKVPPFRGVAAMALPDKKAGENAAVTPKAERPVINCLREIFFDETSELKMIGLSCFLLLIKLMLRVTY